MPQPIGRRDFLARVLKGSTLAVVAARASEMGYNALIGEYVPTAKNGMVREHYDRLGFTPLAEQADERRVEIAVAATHITPRMVPWWAATRRS